MSHLSLKRKGIILLGALLLFSLLVSYFFLYDSPKTNFEEVENLIFQEEMLSNTLNMHFTLAYPENFGISSYNPTLPCYSQNERLSSAATLQKYISTLSSIAQDSLNATDSYTYTLLTRYLKNASQGHNYIYYDEPLSPAAGMQSQLPILLAEYAFRSQTDVEDYLSILDQTDDYFASLVTFEKEKRDAGLLQADSSLKKVIEQCDRILSKSELASGNHFLQTTFSERIDALVKSQILSEEEAEKFKVENNRLLTTIMQPAYESLADELFLLTGDGTSTPHGLATLPDGKSYYSYLVQTTTGSDLSIDEIKNLLYPSFEREYEALHSLLNAKPNAVEMWNLYINDASLPYLNAEDMILDLKDRMKSDFPSLPSEASPNYLLKSVSQSLEKYSAPAYYLTPPLDDPNHNIIYVNQKDSPSGLVLYTTLAHEGYPGHLYQSVYHQLFMQEDSIHPVREVLWYGGYMEGWALYVEFLSFDYAKSLAIEKGLPDAAFSYEIEKHNRNMQLCLYSLLDISIHYDNASFEEISHVLEAFGITTPETARAVYDYIAEEPANYLKYYLGYLEILRLKEKAISLWGNDYSDLRFHQFVLENGPADFKTLQEALASTASSALP